MKKGYEWWVNYCKCRISEYGKRIENLLECSKDDGWCELLKHKSDMLYKLQYRKQFFEGLQGRIEPYKDDCDKFSEELGYFFQLLRVHLDEDEICPQTSNVNYNHFRLVEYTEQRSLYNELIKFV